jgi:hypothetical protein
MHAEWVRSIRDQCRAAEVPFFFKQWGGVRKSRTGRELDGRTHNEMPASSGNPIAPTGVRKELIQRLESQLVAAL